MNSYITGEADNKLGCHIVGQSFAGAVGRAGAAVIDNAHGSATDGLSRI